MSLKTRSPRRRAARQDSIHKPRGKIDQRVQEVGPKRFGIVTVDCAKARSEWMLCDFFGNVLAPPATVEHHKAAFAEMLTRLKQAIDKHRLREILVAVERTGNYHLPVLRAFQAAGYATRVLHPFATKQFREADKPGDKTDENDLAAMHRAVVVGFALIEPSLPDVHRRLRLLVRHRRDLVQKSSALQCQIRDQLHLVLPGYAELFGQKLFSHPGPLALARRFDSPQALLAAGAEGLRRELLESQIKVQQRTLHKILAWAQGAAAADEDAAVRRRVLIALHDDWQAKSREIQQLEVDLAGEVALTPYVLLMAIPGVNVVSAADLAGELGPISHYANANAITGRTGLFPRRHQSDQVDRHGKLVRRANRRLRGALMQVADNLALCNHHFRGLASAWGAQGVDPRRVRVRIAKRFTRLLYAMVAGQQVFPHPCCREPCAIMDKLCGFLLERKAGVTEMRRSMLAATQQLPQNTRSREAAALGSSQARRRKVVHIREAVALVVARLLGEAPPEELESTEEERTSS
jgi:transposase